MRVREGGEDTSSRAKITTEDNTGRREGNGKWREEKGLYKLVQKKRSTLVQ